MSKRIIEVGYGISSIYDEGIEINRELKNPLRGKVILHETQHDEGRYSIKDVKNDFNKKGGYFRESLKWAFKHPTALIGFMPFMYSYYFKALTFNLSATIPFFYFGIIFSGFWWLVLRINFFQTFGFYTLCIILVNLILLGYTHSIIAKSTLDY